MVSVRLNCSTSLRPLLVLIPLNCQRYKARKILETMETLDLHPTPTPNMIYQCPTPNCRYRLRRSWLKAPAPLCSFGPADNNSEHRIDTFSYTRVLLAVDYDMYMKPINCLLYLRFDPDLIRNAHRVGLLSMACCGAVSAHYSC
ncbi:hypothetical protein L1887_20565 [Cichorium endivia]|nr:hypothetical protein L1887_20565 [Cichorium endivia]